MNRHTSSCVCQEAAKLTPASNSFGEQLVQLGAMFSLFTRIRHRQRCQQLLRVGILRVIHNLIGITMFHNLTLMHHHNAIGQHIDHGKIMGDEQACETYFRLQFLEQLQHLHLYRYIQCRSRLVSDKQARLKSQRSCQGGTLTLTARKLMRESVHIRTRQLHHFEQISHIVARFRHRRVLFMHDQSTSFMTRRKTELAPSN